MERESVLDRYFDDVTVKRVSSEQHGWKALETSHYFGVNNYLLFFVARTYIFVSRPL